MRVKATQPGFYGNLRDPDDEFVLSDKRHFSDKWMEKVKEPEKAPPPPPQKKDDPPPPPSNDGKGGDAVTAAGDKSGEQPPK